MMNTARTSTAGRKAVTMMATTVAASMMGTAMVAMDTTMTMMMMTTIMMIMTMAIMVITKLRPKCSHNSASIFLGDFFHFTHSPFAISLNKLTLWSGVICVIKMLKKELLWRNKNNNRIVHCKTMMQKNSNLLLKKIIFLFPHQCF